MRGLSSTILVLGICALVAGCGMPRLSLPFADGPDKTVPNVPRETSVNPAQAVALINEYRKSKGRSPLTNDPRLSAIAASTARELARRNELRTEMHTSDGIAKRLEEANYEASRAAENLGAGYPTLVLAVDGWKSSRGHNRNLLNRDLTHAGIGLALTNEGPYRSFWVLLLATPDETA